MASLGQRLVERPLATCFCSKDRRKAQALYTLGPTAGPIIGPLVGVFVVNRTHNWRWLLWTMTIAFGIIVGVSTLILRETYAPFLLRQKVRRLQKDGDSRIDGEQNVVASAGFGKAILRPSRFSSPPFAP